METNKIPKDFWLNVTVMADYNDSWIVGVLKKGKQSWITMTVFSGFKTSEEAYIKGMDWIEKYLDKQK